jgi:ABC-2 type transport system permease protein
MMNLFSIISKNFKIFLRSRMSALIIFVAPLLIVLLVGTAFNSTNLSDVTIGSYSSSYSELSESLLSGFSEKGYAVNKLNSPEECQDSVKNGKTQLCVVFPPDLSIEGNAEEVVFYVDYSRMNIAYILVNSIETEISAKASELGVTMAQSLIDALVEVQESLPTQLDQISSAIEEMNALDSQAESLVNSLEQLDTTVAKLETAKEYADMLNGSEVDDVKSQIDAAILDINSVTEGASSEGITTQNAQAKSVLGDVSGNIGLLISKVEEVKATEASKVVSPIQTKVESVSTTSSNTSYLFPTLIAFITLFGSIILASTMVLGEKKTKAYFRNFITPTSDFTFLIGTYITCLIILAIQLIILFSGIIWLSDILSNEFLPQLALILFVSATSFIFLGMIIGYSFKSEETAILAAISIATILIFFSNTIFPIESISGWMKNIAFYNPLVLADSSLKRIILFGSDIMSLWYELALLLGSIVIFLGFSIFARKLSKRKM